MTNGIDFYQFVADLSEHFEERKDELTQVLETLSRQIFRGDHMMSALLLPGMAWMAWRSW